jgi:signal transduction histidine kinase
MSIVCRSHEIRTPLSGVLGMISLLNETQLVSNSKGEVVVHIALQL